jgi:GNAT superfamily N-acetyltransferase
MPIRPAQIREATMPDADAIARVHIDSSQEAYAPLAQEWPAADLDARRARWERFLTRWQQDSERFGLVAEVDGRVVGFIVAGPARRDDVGAEVEVTVIHVLPEHRGKGVGSMLWAAACERVRGPALRSMYVETLAELRCCSFYEAHGGELASRTTETWYGGAVTKVVYLWREGMASEPTARG